MFDRQKFFTDSVLGLNRQGFERSAAEDGAGLYAGPVGLGCGIGVVLPRDLAERLDRGVKKSIGHLIPEPTALEDRENAEDLMSYLQTVYGGPIGDEDVEFLRGVQRAHDLSSNSFERSYRLAKLGAEWGIRLPDLPRHLTSH